MIRRTRRFAVVATVLAVIAVAPLTAASAAFAQSTKPEVLATLKVTAEKVEVKKAGGKKFKVAKDGAKLREGDTIRTDATGLAEIDYTDDSYTRLDVNTTFTIKKLTEDQGSRQVQGSLETGQAWNRTTALTESESFEQEGAGANATVLGTAFNVQCDDATHCTFTAVEHDIQLTGRDGQIQLLNPLDQCESDDTQGGQGEYPGILCDEVTKLTVEQMIANSWIQANLLRDLLERGYGPGPFSGTIVVQNGQFFFVPSPDSPPAPPVVQPPVVDGILVPEMCPGEALLTCASAGASVIPPGWEQPDPSDVITVYCGEGCGYQLFRINVVSPADLTGVSIVYTFLPENGDIGYDCVDDYGPDCVGWLTEDDIMNATQFPADTVFAFDPSDWYFSDEVADVQSASSSESSFGVVAVNAGGSSAEQEITTVVMDEYSGCSSSLAGDVSAAC